MTLRVWYLNVGHGDCTIIQHPSGRITMIDINNSQRYDPDSHAALVAERQAQTSVNRLLTSAYASDASSVLQNYLLVEAANMAAERAELTDPIAFFKKNFPGQSIFRFILTHPDMDLMRGLKKLFTQIPVLNFWDTANTKQITSFNSAADKDDWEFYQYLRSGVSTVQVKNYLCAHAGYAVNQEEDGSYGGDGIFILSPTNQLVQTCNSNGKFNDVSFVLEVSSYNKSFIFAGDAETAAWDTMVKTFGGGLKTHYLKASHHGRDSGFHLKALQAMQPDVTIVSVGRKPSNVVDPALILRVRMSGPLLEQDWNQLGLTLLSSDADRNLVLFSNADEMTQFRQRLAAYGRGTPVGQAGPSYNAFIGGIEEIGSVAPRDRIGIRAREDGFVEQADFQDNTAYIVDVELWDIGRRDYRERKLAEIVTFVEETDGRELDRYVGPSITMVRFECDGAAVRNLLTIEEVCEVDFLPEIDRVTENLTPLTLFELPAMSAVDDTAPVIGIIDSGLNEHPLIEDIIVGAIGVPEELGTDDGWGHGTKIAGISVFGDLRAQLAAGTLTRGSRVCSAKVLDNNGEFPNSRLTPRQMREAIARLNAEFACRIFVIALGDRKKVYDGGKVGVWAATLDELARELNVVIIVSAGNRNPRRGAHVEESVTEYPAYLTEPQNRLFEPAGAMNVITVGSISHGNGLAPELAGDVGVLAITDIHEPSPFTRIGPGMGGAIKPDFVDLGGTLIYDRGVARIRGGEDIAEAGMMSLFNRPVDQLFTYASGTSYSAPLVAFKAAQVLRRFPDSSANLIRVLLASSSKVPEPAKARLQHLGDDYSRHICGHGQVDLDRAIFSDDTRVVFYAEDELEIDHFAVYQIPIPDIFQTTRGRRSIRVSLAYDPPVKHSRKDYAGVTMGYRLIRGATADEVFDHYRRRGAEDGDIPDMAARYNCSFDVGPTLREKSSLQTATVTFSRNVDQYGDTYYLVVRCAGGWAGDVGRQGFAVTVELAHEAEIALYARLTQRVRVTT